MCSIIILEPGVLPPYDIIENMVNNNPHGYGLILKENKKLQVIKKCPEKGNDPEEIYDLLKDNKDIKRFLHVRWKTDGAISLANTHPFDSYYSDKRHVLFMHNGVLHEFKPKGTSVTWENNIRIENISSNSENSDSKQFNDLVLTDLLLYGKGDITNPILKKTVEKYWSGDSKGLLVSSDQPELIINRSSWKTITFEGGEFLASNDSYFKTLQRGPVFDEKRKKQEEERRKSAPGSSRFQAGNSNGGTHAWALSDIQDLDFTEHSLVTADLKDLMSDMNIFDDEQLAKLALMTQDEIDNLVKNNPVETVSLLTYALFNYKEYYDKYNKLHEHVSKVEKKAA